MPGCTVPNCSNSSQKGFKLYRFPSDKERNLIWVQNCGRELGWQPTKHTCVCEVHFEDSQFESHRADGLRKLKPNAIPTIFNHAPHIRTYSRKERKVVNDVNPSVSPEFNKTKLTVISENKLPEIDSNTEVLNNECSEKNSMFKESDHTYPKNVVVFDRVQNNNADFIATEEVFVNVAVASKPDDSPKTTGKLKKGQTLKRFAWKESTSESKLKTCKNRKRGRPPDSSSKVQNSPASKIIKNEEMLIEGGIEDISNLKLRSTKLNDIEQKQCYVCGKTVEKGLSLFTLTNTTKVYMYQKLDKIVTGELDLKKEGILCSRCANLLNYMDRIEVELNMVKKILLNCIRKKCGMKVRFERREENLAPTTPEAERANDKLNNMEEKSTLKCSHKLTNNKTEEKDVNNEMDSSRNIEENHSIVESASVEQIQCLFCNFKSIYKSVFIFHLRQHLRNKYWCDFCNVPIPYDAFKLMERHYNPLLDLNDSSNETEDIFTEQEEEIDSIKESNSCAISADPGLAVTIVPDNNEDLVTTNIIETVPNKNYSADPTSIDTNDNKHSLERNTKQIRVLNELGKIIMQEVTVLDNPEKTVKSVSQPIEYSEFSLQSKPVELQVLETSVVSELGYCDRQTSTSVERIQHYQIINEMGMIIVAEGQETQLFTSRDIGSESAEVSIGVTPNILTDSSENFSAIVKDNEGTDNIFER